MNRIQIVIANISLAIVLAALWAAFLSRDGLSIKNSIACLTFICIVAAPVDLLAGLVCLAFKKKVWASALLWSGTIFVLILVFGIATAKMLS